MKFEELYQELEREVEMLRVLVVGMTVEQARSQPEAQSSLHVIGHPATRGDNGQGYFI